MPVLGVFDHGFLDKVMCPLCKDRFYGPVSAENCQVTQVQFLDKVICPLCAKQV